MSNDLEGREMPEWQAAALALLMAVVVAAIAWAIIDPDGAADASTRYWMNIHELKFWPQPGGG